MLDIKFIIKNKNIVKESLKKRNEVEKISWIDDLISKYDQWKSEKLKLDSLRHRRNNLSEEINKLKKQKKDISKIISDAKDLPKKIIDTEQLVKELEEKINYYLRNIPNILHKSVPIGKDEKENKVIRKWGKIPNFKFELKPHGEWLEELNQANFEQARRVSGTGFFYLKDKMAQLDLALQRFAIDFLIKKGFMLIEPPFMLRKDVYADVVSLNDFKNVMYKIENEDLYLIATSEHPLMALFKDKTLNEAELPVQLVGISACFRKEIGSHGVDTRGLFRVHQFNKVEQVVLCKPEDSWKWHEQIQKNSEQMLQLLKIPYRVVNICTGDLGPIASKKYDIEAYFPREKAYKEVTSASNCTDYQTNGLNTKYVNKKGEKIVPHSLNNTGLATSRVMRAIIENYQQKDGSVKVPKVLQKYLNFKVIENKHGKIKKNKRKN